MNVAARRWVGLCASSIVLLAALATGARAAEALPDVVEFNRDIRHIFSDTCYQCHGPDENQRVVDFRLDTKDGAFADLGGYHAIVPGDLEASELYRRITADDPDERMPPEDADRKLAPHEIELIRRWIEQGAEWQGHWSFIPPKRPPLPQVSDPDWPACGLDYFVLARLDREGLRPSPEADRATLIRRVTLDLTGLPPTPEEVDAFLADRSPGAYERVVDRLLASPRYGERMTADWLNAARYADTNGYQNDGEREMWRWRDWVIEAFNRNMPFDRFTIEQLAGDLLPDPTLDQRIATGFNRNHRGNSEGGIIPEEYAVEYVVDRVETTGTVWMGLTIGCARCHDHKYDPISQREFYQLFAYFNNVPENGRAVKDGNSAPMIKAPTPEMQRKLDDYDRRLAAAERHFRHLTPKIAAAQAAWEATLDPHDAHEWTVTKGLSARFPLDGNTAEGEDGAPPATWRNGDPMWSPGITGDAAAFDGRRYLDAGNVGGFGDKNKFSLGAWIRPDGRGEGAVLARMADDADRRGYGLRLASGKLQVNLVNRWLDDAIRIETRRPLAEGQWHHVMATYDGSKQARGVAVYVDGERVKVRVLLDILNNESDIDRPLLIGGDGLGDGFHGAIDEVRLYRRVLSADEVARLAESDSIDEIAAVPAEERTSNQSAKITAYFLERAAGPDLRAAAERVETLRAERAAFEESIPTTMVMEEMPEPRQTHVLIRGEYDKPGEPVTAGVPAVFPPLPSGAPNNRLGLARWLVDPAHPLTARVIVNRYWQLLFGAGLVTTVEDFGSQGEWPSHPELLDWLATDFVEGGWDLKALLRQIVTSATYRQASQVTPELLAADPSNRLLARGPRFRLSAEVIRDQALAASGLLVERLGGPSVHPYQPVGLWEEVTPNKVYTQDHGEALYRRSMYTFWKRTVAPPGMMTFDASSRETCVVRQARTNTPLQALTLMNDVIYVEAARHLAERAMIEGGESPRARIRYAFRLLMARRPTDEEAGILLAGFKRQRSAFAAQPEAAVALLSVGESPRNESLDPVQLAAYSTVANVIFNLDEAVTRE